MVVVAGDSSTVDDAIAAAFVYRRRLTEARAFVVPAYTDGGTSKANALGEVESKWLWATAEPQQWRAYFEELLSERGMAMAAEGAWIGLNLTPTPTPTPTPSPGTLSVLCHGAPCPQNIVFLYKDGLPVEAKVHSHYYPPILSPCSLSTSPRPAWLQQPQTFSSSSTPRETPLLGRTSSLGRTS